MLFFLSNDLYTFYLTVYYNNQRSNQQRIRMKRILWGRLVKELMRLWDTNYPG
jgi:hypothetical protein